VTVGTVSGAATRKGGRSEGKGGDAVSPVVGVVDVVVVVVGVGVRFVVMVVI